MKKVIDIHSHLLPGVDDGCKSFEEAKEMLRMYEEQNVEAVICTPHFGPCSVEGADIDETFDQLKATQNSVKLYLGNEIYVTPNTLRHVRNGYAKRIAGSDHALIEFAEWWAESASARDIIISSVRIAKSEFHPILAHAERYWNLQGRMGLYQMLTEHGVKLQVNAYDICENNDPMIRRTARALLKKGLVSFVGSDAHGAYRRSPNLASGVKWIYDNCPEEYADAIVHDNAEKLIKIGRG